MSSCLICLDSIPANRDVSCPRCHASACQKCLISYFETNINPNCVFGCPECRQPVWTQNTLRAHFPVRIMEGPIRLGVIEPCLWARFELQVPRYQEEAADVKRIRDLNIEITKIKEEIEEIRERTATFMRNGYIQGVEDRDGLNVYDDAGHLVEVYEGPVHRDYGVGYDRPFEELNNDERKRTIRILLNYWSWNQTAQKKTEQMFGFIREVNRLSRKEYNTGNVESQLVRCPCAPNCNGYVRNGQCGFCTTKVCAQCREIEGENHICDESVVQSIAMIQRESKPCPNCSVSIVKTDGCDQMFCVLCRTVFDWVSGNVVRGGNIHNPLAIEVLRNEGNLQRMVGDIPCGGFPNLSSWIQAWNRWLEKNTNEEVVTWFKQDRETASISRKRQRDGGRTIVFSHIMMMKSVMVVIQNLMNVQGYIRDHVREGIDYHRLAVNFLNENLTRSEVLHDMYIKERESLKLMKDLETIQTVFHLVAERTRNDILSENTTIDHWNTWFMEMEGIREMANESWISNGVKHSTIRNFAIEAGWMECIIPRY